MKMTAKIASKGQITIPKSVRQKLGIREGERVSFIERNGTFFIKKAIPKSPFDKWVGKLNKNFETLKYCIVALFTLC